MSSKVTSIPRGRHKPVLQRPTLLGWHLAPSAIPESSPNLPIAHPERPYFAEIYASTRFGPGWSPRGAHLLLQIGPGCSIRSGRTRSGAGTRLSAPKGSQPRKRPDPPGISCSPVKARRKDVLKTTVRRLSRGTASDVGRHAIAQRAIVANACPLPRSGRITSSSARTLFNSTR